MYAKKKEKVRKEIINTNEMNNIMDNIYPGMEGDEISQEEGQLIINYDDDEGEIQNTNDRYYQQDLNINNQKNVQNMKKQIYTKVRSDSYNKPFAKKVKISNYIYKTQRNSNAPNSNITTDYIRFNNNSKYFIKNPVKEKSRNKINKNNSSNNFYFNRNIKKNVINTNNINNMGNNTDIIEDNYNYIDMNGENEEEIGNINNTNYYFKPRINMEINNNKTEYLENETPIYININKSKGGNINLNPQKRQFVSANRRTNYYNKNENRDEPSPRESRISYIYDYSQENNKNSYYVESPHNIKYISAYPLKIKKKNKNKNKTEFIKLNNKNHHTNNDNDRLKKLIEESKRKFDNIREIEKKIKNYFNLNGLNIENRELYDQSATMIQSAFRAYSSRLHLYKEINLFVNISLLNDLLKKIFLPRKRLYWETFSQNIKNYISLATNPTIDKIIDTLSSNNNDKIIYTKNNSKKRMPVSYNKKNNIKVNNMLLPQLIASFNYIGNCENVNMDSEEIIKKLKTENDDLKKKYEILKEQYEKITNNNKNNIIKDTQESVDLKLGDGVNLALINSSNENKDLLKLSKLKYLTKNKALKTKENLHKYFLKMFYNALLSKNSEKNKTEEVEKIEDEKYKKLRNLIVKKEKDIKNIIRNKYMIYYFKGKINEMQTNNNINSNNDNEKKDLNNNLNNIEKEKNKENREIENENEKNEINI